MIGIRDFCVSSTTRSTVICFTPNKNYSKHADYSNLFTQPLSICLYQIRLYRDYTISIQDHLSNAISMQQVSCLCLLDLSAAFDTLDHSILLHRLSTWFGISSVSLQWFTSYLSSRTSTVGIPLHSSPSSPLTCGVPQGSVLAQFFSIFIRLLFALLSVLLLSLTYLQYADDTQLFISFVPKNFSSAINNLQSTITLISCWMFSYSQSL